MKHEWSSITVAAPTSRPPMAKCRQTSPSVLRPFTHKGIALGASAFGCMLPVWEDIMNLATLILKTIEGATSRTKSIFGGTNAITYLEDGR